MDSVAVPEWEGSSRVELLALLASQARVVQAQARRTAELQRQLSRNSGNSSMPPPTDDLPGRRLPVDKPARGSSGKRRRGKQPGAPGAFLAWRQVPDETISHSPAGRCGCGRDLAGAADAGVVASHQVHDIPQVAATVTQHDLHRVRYGLRYGACGTAPERGARRITRTRTTRTKTRQTAYLVMSLPAADAQPVDLGTWAEQEWHIEDRIMYVT